MEYQVYVDTVGLIGTVEEKNEALARCMALYKFADDSERTDDKRVIYCDDNFHVTPI